MSVGSTHHLEMVFVWKQNYILVDEYFFFCCTWIVNSAEIKLFNRRDEFFDKALAFAQRVNENTDCVVTVTDLADQQAFAEALASADILTNGTKVGMKPLENESLVNDISLLHPGLLVTECVYNPHMTKLLQQAQQAGCKTIDGYGMLLWQGAEQFTLWTGKDFPLEYVKQVMGFGA